MPTLHKYTKQESFYVRHCFRDNEDTVFINYQVGPRAEATFIDLRLGDGDSIPHDLFHRLRSSGDLFTGGIRTEAGQSTCSATKEEIVPEFEALSKDARRWVWAMIALHPFVIMDQYKNEGDEEVTMNLRVSRPIGRYLEHLIEVARSVEDPEFFCHLEASYRGLFKNSRNPMFPLS